MSREAPRSETVLEDPPAHIEAPGNPVAEEAGVHYWAVIDPVPRPLTIEALRYALEPFLPAPIDETDCRFVRIGAGSGGAIIACAVERGVVGTEPPQDFPDFIAECVPSGLRAETLAAVRFATPGKASRTIKAATLCSVFVLMVGLLCVGMIRRAEHYQRVETAARAALAELVNSTLGSPRGAEITLPPAARLQAEARRLARTRTGSDSEQLDAAHDVGADFIALLAAWPESFPIRVEQIDLRAGTLTLRGTVRDTADFEALKRSLTESLDGYDTPAGSVTRAGGRAGEGFAFNLAMRRKEMP